MYTAPQRISIAAKESAVVPIMSLAMKGKRVLVFDPKENEVNATKAVHLYNTSEVVLSNGNVSVLEGGRFVQQVRCFAYEAQNIQKSLCSRSSRFVDCLHTYASKRRPNRSVWRRLDSERLSNL